MEVSQIKPGCDWNPQTKNFMENIFKEVMVYPGTEVEGHLAWVLETEFG